MNVSQRLIESISEDLHIRKGKDESEADWIARVVYSAIAKNAYCSYGINKMRIHRLLILKRDVTSSCFLIQKYIQS